jgi:hypothetical protein
MKAIKIIFLLPLLTIGCLPVKRPSSENIVNTIAPSNYSNDNFKHVVGCYYLDTQYGLKGKTLTSCDPDYIKTQITADFATVMTWEFVSDHEILRSEISTKKMNALGTNDVFSKNKLIKKGKKITEILSNGCEISNEIIEDTTNYIILKSKGSKNCSAVVTNMNKSNLNKNTKYIKVSD